MELLWVQKLLSKTSAVPQINDETATHDFILYSPISCMKNKGFLSMWLVTLRNKRFVCVVCLFQSPLPFSLLCTKTNMSSCRFSVPCLSLWVCHSTREQIRMSLDTVWPGTDFAGVLKHTAYRVRWNLRVWLVWSFLQKCSFFCQFTEVISESISTSFLPNHCNLPNVVF